MRAEPYHCHNREPFKAEMTLQRVVAKVQRWGEGVGRMSGTVIVPEVTVVPFRNSTDCQYTLSNLGQIDPGCAGCKHRKL